MIPAADREYLSDLCRTRAGLQVETDKAYLIVDGEVSVRKHGTEVAKLGPGDVIGEVSIVEHKLRTASVVSLTELEVIHFTRESLESLIEKVPAFGDAIRATAAERLDADKLN